MSRRALLTLAGMALTVCASAQSPTSACSVEPYRGATTPQGALAVVKMTNRGQVCEMPNYGYPAEGGNPATSGRILVPPKHGRARFDAPVVAYLPDSGFVGSDEFEYEAMTTDRTHRPLRLYVRVQVTVSAP